jgi:hypothetical protein
LLASLLAESIGTGSGAENMQVYINYPNPHFTICQNSSCQQIHMHQKSGQRIVKVNTSTLKNILSQFVNDAFDFKSEAQLNDLRLNISLSTSEQEIGFVHIVQAILGQRYKPPGSAPISEHC